MSRVTVKVFHDPEKARARGRMDGRMNYRGVDFLPCKCDQCRGEYLFGWTKGYMDIYYEEKYHVRKED